MRSQHIVNKRDAQSCVKMDVGSRGALLFLLLLALSEAGLGQLIDCAPGTCGCCVCFPGGSPYLRFCSPLTHQSFAESSPRLTDILPGSFQHADHILSLNLSYNAPLSLNDESFVGLTNLTDLFLQGNDLGSLTDDLFTPMAALEILNLEHNQLAELNSAAFRSLFNLEMLLLGYNSLTVFPSDLLWQLPAFRNISLHPNPWNCSSEQISTLVQLLQTGIVTDGNQLTCDNSTLVSDINIEGPSPTSIQVTPSPSPLQQVTSSIQATPTPSPRPTNCTREENVATTTGFFDWPETAEGEVEVSACPHGPDGGVATRECGAGGTWGEVNVVQCSSASPTVQALLSITQTTISMANSLSVSSLLSSTLSSSSAPLTLDEVEVVADLTEELLQISGESVQVLNNTLQALDSLLTSSGASVLEGGSSTASRLRSIIDTVLLAALSADQSNLVLTFSHLAVGGVYIKDTNHTHILAVITTSGEGEDLVIGEGGEGGGGDVEVDVEGEIQGPVQVTVYMNSTLFNSTSCGKDGGTKGDDLAPIISVSDEQTTTQETVTLTYHGVQVSEGDDVLCVRWNSSLNCGQGGWQTSGCRLDRWQDNDLVCVCTGNGTFTILESPSSVQAEGELGGVVKYIFYACCGLALILYLPVILVVLLSRSLRPLPLKQCTANMAASQALSFIVMAASYHHHALPELCYSLAVLLHYLLLVSLIWFSVYPALALLKVFRRRWFELPWLLAPVAVVCWVLPAILIGAIGATRYDGYADSPEICWMEVNVFPNYFTYLSVLLALLSLVLTVLVILLLCCSDYDLELPVHLRVVSAEVNAGFFSMAMVCHFITADAAAHGGKYSLDSDYLLLVVTILVFSCATYFLVANGGANSHIRSTLLCREDPVLKRKVAHYNESSHTPSSLASSRTSDHRNLRRSAMHLHDEMNLNYVNSYLGYDEVSSSHVPLDMLQQVNQSREGRRVRGDRREPSGPLGPTGFRNVGFKVPHPTSML